MRKEVWRWVLRKLPGRCSQCGGKHQESQGLLREISAGNGLRLWHCANWCEAYYSLPNGASDLRSYLGRDELEECRELEEWAQEGD